MISLFRGGRGGQDIIRRSEVRVLYGGQRSGYYTEVRNWGGGCRYGGQGVVGSNPLYYLYAV